MSTRVLTPAKANFDLMLLNADAESMSSSDLYLWLSESGLPSEVAIRLYGLVDTTKKVVNRVVSIGKIILIKIIEFIKAHPNLLIGMGIGATIGYAIAALVATIPILGSFLAPIVAIIPVAIGAVAGHRLDKIEKRYRDVNLVTIAEDIIEIAKAFFKLLADIFNAVFNEQVLQGA